MPYATVADLQARLGEARLVQLTDIEDPPLGLVRTNVADRALEDASDTINGYLIGRYALPLASPPAVLRVHCLTLAHAFLLGNAATEIETQAAKDVHKFLASVAEGRVPLLPPADAPAPAGAGAVLFAAGRKSMGRAALHGGDAEG